MNLSQRLRTCAKHTGLDAVIELLQEAADEIDALQARAQATHAEPQQPDNASCKSVQKRLEAQQPAATEPVWFHKHWGDDDDIFYRPDDKIPPGSTPLYTTPQPAQAAQAEVTDEFLYELWEQKYRSWIGGEQFEQIARAILALRPVQVPMTPASRDVIMATRTANADADEWPEPWAYQRGWNDAEAHHGTAAQAKKETP